MARPKTTTEALLTEWGKWTWIVDSKSGGCVGYVSPLGVMINSITPACNRLSINISDDDAMRVSHAVASLYRSNRLSHRVLELTYRYERGERQVSDELNISRRDVVRYLADGVGYIRSMLENNFSEAA